MNKRLDSKSYFYNLNLTKMKSQNQFKFNVKVFKKTIGDQKPLGMDIL